MLSQDNPAGEVTAMRRRDFLSGCGTAIVSQAVHAQPSSPLRTVGVLMGPPEADLEAQARVTAFERGLEAVGWRKDFDVRLEYRWDASEGPQATEQAAALVARQPDVLLVNTPAGLAALQRMTQQIPIVFVQYLTQDGIKNLAKPGGNTTGFAMLDDTLDLKWLELLKEIAPDTRRVASMQNPEHPSWGRYTRSIMAAAPKLGMRAAPSPVRHEADIERNIAELAREPDGALIVLPATFNTTHRKLIIGHAAKHRVPATYPNRFYALDGGLASYGGDLPDLMRQAATYVGYILRGARPPDVPVQQTMKLELVLNLKTAKALGLAISPVLVVRADEVIE